MGIGRWSSARGAARGRVVAVVLVVMWALVDDQARRAPCDVAFDDGAWEQVVSVCGAARWGRRVDLARAWRLLEARRDDDALVLAEQLLDTNVAADAAYLAGHARSRRDGAAEADLTRRRLHQALDGYLRAGRHADASRAAGALSRVPRPQQRFDDQLRMATLAVTEAERSGDVRVLGRAVAALAESYDWIGMADAARESFLRAEELMAPFADQLAQIYFKHAGFLLDLGTPPALATSLYFLDAATAQGDRAVANGRGASVQDLPLAISLNRADALSQLGRLDDASRELDRAARDLATPGALGTLRLVQGYVAARGGEATRAEALFREADDGALESDYRIRVALERARMYRDAGRRDDAERAYRDAIALIEKVRSTASEVELRPWVLARRTSPYVELLALLVEQDRGQDALVVAESLHARAWLDVVLDQDVSDGADQALTAARIRQRMAVASAPALDSEALMAAIGDREALIFLSTGDATWRGHVVDRRVRFERLSGGAIEEALKLRLDDPVALDRASRVLLPAGLSTAATPLYVIASGALRAVPFAALRWRGRYLIEHRSVARLPGLAVLRCDATARGDRVVLLGDSRGDLPGAAEEVHRIAASLGITAHVGAAATRAALLQAHGARLLHIAVHAIRAPSGHARALALSDGALTAADVLDADLDPEDVVLAGCATAESSDAESWDGFPSAFLAAGSRHVVATLTSVDDAAAERMSRAYYDQPASLGPIDRLAAAQRALMDVLPMNVWSSVAAWGRDACEARDPASPLAHTP